MTTPFSLPHNTIPTDPSMADMLNQVKKDVMLEMNCHHVATIQAFDPDKQTAQATVNYKRTIFILGQSKTYVPKLVDYPILVDCPVIFLGGGTTSLTFPVAVGDQCLVLFNDVDMDNWYQGSVPGGVASPRRHSFADGLILVGPRSMAKVLQGFDMTRVALNNGNTVVGVGASLVKIANNLYTLNDLLQELVNDVKTLVSATAAITVPVTTAPGVSGVPVNAATITAVNTSLTATANKIAGLLE